MGKRGSRILFSVFLIGFGIFLLLGNLNLIPGWMNNRDVFWQAAFLLGGAAFLMVFLSDVNENWWAVIPSFTLIGLSAVIGFSYLPGGWSGGLFLGMIGLSFWVIYAVHREMWWAVIPGGVLVTLGLVAGISDMASANGFDEGGIFFLGLALTFLLVYLLPSPVGRMQWAIWPAGVLGTLAIVVMAGSSGLVRFIWPVALVLAGFYLVFQTTRKQSQ